MSISDDRLDQAIDDVAAGMIAGEPSAAFTTRVVDRIESLETRRLRWRSLAWIPAATCAAAAAIALILWIKPTPHADARSKRSVETAEGSRHVDAPSEQVATVITVTRTAFAAAAPATARAGSMRVAVTTTVRAAAPPPLEAFAPPRIDIAPVGVAPLAVVGVALPESIAPETLEPVAPVAVTPLSSDDAQRRFE